MYEHDDEHTSWQDDLRVEMVHQFLSGVVGAAEVAELDMPHIVVCSDGETGAVTYSGPFPNGMTALVFAEREMELDRQLNAGLPLSFGVSALYPAEQPDPR